MNDVIKSQTLKERLGQIDNETICVGLPCFTDAVIESERGMWRKGCAIIETYPEAENYNGKVGKRSLFVVATNIFSWAKLEKETGRKDKSIKAWVRLAKQIGKTEDDFMTWAEGRRTEIAERFDKKTRSLNRSTITPELPDGKYRIIYADPPWFYTDHPQHSEEGIDQKTILETHYEPMTDDELCALKVIDIAGDNAVMFLWTTSPLLERTFPIIEAWGFKYKTSMIWDKVLHNVGYYVSVRHVFLLICTKGTCLPDVPKLMDSVYSGERTEHSAKPEYFRNLIDELYPDGKRVELFARSKHDNWDSWGNEV